MKRKFTFLIAAALMLLTMMATTGEMWGQDKITDYTNIVSGTRYYIGATTGSTDYYLSVDGSSLTLSIAGTAVTSTSNATPFTFTGSETTWTIQFDNGYYLSLKTTKDNGKVQVVENAASFTASNQSSKIRMQISGANFSIQKNNSGTQFGSYGNTQTDIWLIEVSTGPTQLSAPTNFAATAGNTQATFTWDAVEHASSYTISYTTDGETWNDIENLDGTSYTKTGLTNGTEYTCKIKAVGDGEDYSDSDYSSTITVTPINVTFYDITIASPITGGSVTASAATATAGTTITLTATASSGYSFENIVSNWITTPAVTVTPGANNTATFEMPANNITVSATFTAEPDYEWVLTNLADLTAEDIFVIVGYDGEKTYAMSNNNGTSSAPAAVEVTISNDDKITSNVVDNIKWTISGNSTNGYTFYPNGSTTTWLYCSTTAPTGSNNNMRVGTGARKLFAKDNNDYFVTKDDNTDRYVSVYNSSDWRGYVNTTTAPTTVTFYKQQEATNDPTIGASNVEIAYDATEGSISYTINNYVAGTMSASTEANWITNFTYQQGENGSVGFTTSINPNAVSREATVTLTYTYSNRTEVTKDVTITQASNPNAFNNISDITAASTNYRIKGTIVAKSARAFVLGDGTGYAYYYNGNEAPTQNVGNKVIVEGTTSTYGNLIQFPNTSTITATETSNYDGSPAVTIIDEVPTTYSAGLHLSDYFQFEGVLSYSQTDALYLVAVGTSSIAISYPNNTIELDNLKTKKVRVKGYFAGINSKNYFSTIIESIEEVAVPIITVEPSTINQIAGSGEGVLTVTYVNITDIVADVYYCNSTGTESAEYDWIDADIDNDNNVYYIISANTSNARTAYFKVSAFDDEMNIVYSNLVTVNQAEYVAPENKYVRFTGNLVEGDYLIVYDDAAMNTTVSSDRLQYEDVTINDNVIANDNDAIIWHIAPSGNYWTIYNADEEAYAASTGAKNKAQLLDDGTDDKALWTVTGTDTYDFVNKANDDASVNAYLRRNGNYGFACYAESTGGALSLYKKNCVLPVTNDELTASVTIPDGDASVYDNLTIPAGEDYVLTVSGTLEVTGTFTNTVAEHLIIEDGGQLIYNGSVQATMKKSTAHSAKTAADWYTIASPLKETVTTTSGNTNLTTGLDTDEYDLYRYNETAMKWENSKAGANSTNFTNIEAGRGYLYWREDGADLVFAGELRNNDVNYTLTAGAENDDLKGFNLIGNPFSQNITMSNITGATLTGGYVLTQAGAWGASVETTIAPCQGFLVQVDAAKNITISKTPAGKSRANRNYIAFTVANSQYEDVTYAMFVEGLGLNKINHRNANIPMLYIAQNDENYAIATMSEETQSFNLNFKAMTTGQYTLSFKAEGKYDYLHVIDRMTGEDIDMLLDGEYSFIASPSDNDARFIVKLGYNTNNSAENDIFAFQNGSDIVVNGEGELQVFDVTGRMVATQHVNGVQTVNVPSQGVFIFKLNEKTQKIVVR